jgi:hypothetical protein
VVLRIRGDPGLSSARNGQRPFWLNYLENRKYTWGTRVVTATLQCTHKCISRVLYIFFLISIPTDRTQIFKHLQSIQSVQLLPCNLRTMMVGRTDGLMERFYWLTRRVTKASSCTRCYHRVTFCARCTNCSDQGKLITGKLYCLFVSVFNN